MTIGREISPVAARGAGAGAAVLLGLTTCARRLARRSTALTAILGLTLAITAGIIERRVTAADAVSRSLAATFRLVVPLFCFALAVAASDRTSLREAAWPVARYGASRRGVALGISVALVIGSAVGGALLSVAAVISAHSASATPFMRDAFTSGWIGGLTGAAYAAWFALGASFFERGRGRWVPLVLDFVVGGGTGVVAALLPRAHARGLLGGDGPLGMSQPESSLVLALMVFALPVLAALKCRD
jgi:hypothetical protein